MQNLFNIKGFRAAKGGALCKRKPADSGQILHNPEGADQISVLFAQTRPQRGLPLGPGFPQKSLKIWSVKPLSDFRDTL